jgi:hypothetical protein
MRAIGIAAFWVAIIAASACGSSSSGGCPDLSGSWSLTGSCSLSQCTVTQSACDLSVSCNDGTTYAGNSSSSTLSFGNSTSQCSGTLDSTKTVANGSCQSMSGPCDYIATCASGACAMPNPTPAPTGTTCMQFTDGSCDCAASGASETLTGGVVVDDCKPQAETTYCCPVTTGVCNCTKLWFYSDSNPGETCQAAYSDFTSLPGTGAAVDSCLAPAGGHCCIDPVYGCQCGAQTCGTDREVGDCGKANYPPTDSCGVPLVDSCKVAAGG